MGIKRLVTENYFAGIYSRYSKLSSHLHKQNVRENSNKMEIISSSVETFAISGIYRRNSSRPMYSKKKFHCFQNPENTPSFKVSMAARPEPRGEEKSHIRSRKLCFSLLKCQCPLITKSLPLLIKVNVIQSGGHHPIHYMHSKSFLRENFHSNQIGN